MTHVLTLVASHHALTEKHVKQARDTAGDQGLAAIGTPVWLAARKAAEITVAQKPPVEMLHRLRRDMHHDGIDIFSVNATNRRKKLLLADMESTIVDKEALDELAAFVGLEDRIATITAKAMNDELDFRAALFERVGLLKDLPASALQKVLDSMNLNPGARELVATMKKHGATCVLVSGGFTFFTGPVAQLAGFDHHHGNTLEIQNGKLTGRVVEPILDKFAKLDFLKKYVAQLGITKDDVMAVGDGANDIPMLKAAGLGIGYKPKESVAREMENLIIHGDFMAALYAQGFRDSYFS